MLNIIKNLLDELEDHQIPYCNWKSNKYLSETLSGEVDIELLCRHEDASKVQQVLYDCGYERFDDVPLSGFSGLKNYIGYDSKSGELVHVHLHCELTFGTPYLKEYVSPWGSYVIENRIDDKETGVPIADPHIELVLLLIRYALKIRWWNPLSRRSHFNEFHDEYEWLQERTTVEETTAVCHKLISDEVATHVRSMLEFEPTRRDFHVLRSLVRPELQSYSTYGRTSVPVLALFRKSFRGLGKLNDKLLRKPIPTRRTPASGGIEVAFVGIDGSGKSTHVETIHDWLSWKSDVYPVYFGSGDGRSSLLRFPLKKINQFRQKLKQNKKEQSINNEFKPSQKEQLTENESVGPAKALWAITLAIEKRSKRRRSKFARNRGMVVVMDRYPQNQFPGHNDGPLLAPWQDSQSRLLKRLSKWEYKIYEDIQETPPDLVIKLKTSPETAKERKPETPLNELKKKAKTINNINYSKCETVVVDTEQDIESVTNQVKSTIWNKIRGNQ